VGAVTLKNPLGRVPEISAQPGILGAICS